MTKIGNVVLINDFANENGGSAAIAVLAARQYRRLGYSVTFISGDTSNPELEAIGVTMVSLGSRPLLELPGAQAMWQGLSNRHAEKAISRWISEHDTVDTVYHLHSWAQILSPTVFRALRPVETRTVVTCHDFFNICPNGGFTNFPKSAPCELRPLSLQCMSSNCDRRSYMQKGWRLARQANLNDAARFKHSRCTFTFLHEKMREKFVAAGFAGTDLVAIPNPASSWTQKRIEAERNRSFLFVGRVGRDKGADLAIDAAKASGQRLTLIGAGEIADAKAEESDQIRYAGWQDRQGILDLARNARALIVPSRVVEPFGLVILEAAMSGLPVIVSSHGYLAEDVLRIGCGLAFDVAEPPSLAAAMDLVARDDALVERMSRAGVEHAASLCSTPESWTNSFVEIFERKLQQCGHSIPVDFALENA